VKRNASIASLRSAIDQLVRKPLVIRLAMVVHGERPFFPTDSE
jgi:hypothetical protein